MEKKIMGAMAGLDQNMLGRLENLYDFSTARSEIISGELLTELNELTLILNREIALYINRQGRVEMVSVGSRQLAQMPEIWRKRSSNGLSGVRCIHTHPNGQSHLSQPDLSALIQLRLDGICAVGVGEKMTTSLAMLRPEKGVLGENVALAGPFSVNKLLSLDFQMLLAEVERALDEPLYHNVPQKDRAVLAALFSQHYDEWEKDDVMTELVELAKTAGLEVVGQVIQKKEKPDGAYFLGKGKLEEIALLAQNHQADCLVVEKALSPSQQNNLTKRLNLKVIDKTTLILDIFAQRARSKEGKLQVELAQLNYLLPRLSGHGTEMSRLGGGIGTRGPGETKLESDKRHIRRRIEALRHELEIVRKNRAVQRKRKERNQLPQAALIGYTNAGKSSLLNLLADEQIYVQDQLFATLDTTTRAISLPDETKVLLTDTVGFIRDLPPQLIEAFKATLEELQLADLLIHVVDVSNKNFENQIRAVQHILSELDVQNKPMIYVFNKIDQLAALPAVSLDLPKENCCYMSVKARTNLDQLLTLLTTQLSKRHKTILFSLPVARGDLLSKLYSIGKVAEVCYDNEVVKVRVAVNENDMIPELEEYIVLEIENESIF